MHPAYSVIFFTTASGMGYGMLALLGLLAGTETLPADTGLGIAGLLIALAAVTGGLLSSTFHLGHPERAWRAYSQWRSSWLSREGVLATVTYAPALVFAYGWLIEGEVGGIWRFFALLTAMFAILTVYATGMIYRSLKTVRAWHNRHVVPIYLLLAAMTGAVWINALLAIFAEINPVFTLVVTISIFVAFFLKRRYWRFIDLTVYPTTVASATGLDGMFDKVRLLDLPNTQENFVQKEMGYRIARKHSTKLRRIAFIALFAVPLAFTLLPTLLDPTGWVAIPCTLIAALSVALGVVVERWLFFAEATHVVNLYYGADTV